MPLLSVVIPTHERPGRVPLAVESVLTQTERDLEVIVVDDGSKDETPALVARLAETDPRVRYVRLGGGSGAAGARNRGIAEASGQFLAFLDDDDQWHPRKAELQISFLRDNPSVGLLGCAFEVVDEARGELGVYRGPGVVSRDAMLWANLMMGASFNMLRRGAFSFTPSFDPSVVPAEDWDLWTRCADERAVGNLPEVLCRYVIHGPQLTGTVAGRVRGEGSFYAKYRERMSHDARAYNQARLRMIGAGKGAGPRMIARLRIIADTPPAVSLLLLRLGVAARAGRAVGDLGRPARVLQRAVDRIDR